MHPSLTAECTHLLLSLSFEHVLVDSHVFLQAGNSTFLFHWSNVLSLEINNTLLKACLVDLVKVLCYSIEFMCILCTH